MRCITFPRSALVLLSAVAIAVGCGDAADKSNSAKKPAPVTAGPPDTVGKGHDDHDHGHASEGPHHGDLVELGDEEYHAEVVHGKDGEVAIYILGSDAKTAVPIEAADVTVNVVHGGQPEQIKVAASPDAGDPPGKSSRFVSKDPELAEHLDEKGTNPRLVVSIAGKSFTGKIAHDHDHGGKHDHKH